MKKIITMSAILAGILIINGCGPSDNDNLNGNYTNQTIPIDSNIELGNEEGIVYYVDPKFSENGLNRSLKIDYFNMTYSFISMNGINPHSIDRAGNSDRFYVRTQDSFSFDIVNFNNTSVRTVPLANVERGVSEHKPRAIGGYNSKYNIQLLSSLDMPVIDIIDVSTDTVIKTVGNQENNYNIGTNAGEAATGHGFWFDEDHFCLIDRVSNLLRIYSVSLGENSNLEIILSQEIRTTSNVHAVEKHGNLFYAMVDGDVRSGLAPSILELSITNGQVNVGRSVSLSESIVEVNTIKPTTHHSAITSDGKTIIVPVLDGKVYFIDISSLTVKTIVLAKLGAAHVNVSSSENIIIITNHYSNEITFIDGTSLTLIDNLTISNITFNPNDKHLLQPHFSYIGSSGRYFYTFSTQDGEFLKIDLKTLDIKRTLFTGGAPEQSHS